MKNLSTPPPDITHYCLGFALSLDGQKIALLQKKHRPAFLIDKWTGIGGHVETGEHAQAAIQREFEEEAGVITPVDQWIHLDRRSNEHGVLDVFAIRMDLSEVHACTDEPIRIFNLNRLPDPDQLGLLVAQDIEAAHNKLGFIYPKPRPHRPR